MTKITDTPDEINKIVKKFGEGAIFQIGDTPPADLEVIPTGSLALDAALGVGGLPLGRVHEIFGPESAGKTTVCQYIIANAQKLGHPCAFIDMENALDLTYAAACGVEVASLYIAQPDTGEQALDIVDLLVHSGRSWVVVVDSVAALVPRAEIEGDMGDSHMGLQARLMSQALRKMSNALSVSKSMLLFTNQLRMKIGVMFGNPETTTGGNALKFYATCRLDIRRKETKKEEGAAVSNRTKVRVVKNKVAPPLREAEFDIVFGQGIDRAAELLDLGVQRGFINRRGSHHYLGELHLGNSRDNSCDYLRGDPDLAGSLEVSIRESFKQTPAQPVEEEPEGGF